MSSRCSSSSPSSARGKGKPLGVLSRIHDLLPGRYAFGLTGRGPAGKPLAPGRYVVRLRAHPPAGDVGAGATVGGRAV